ncbi:MAG: SbcC/MukB-like Walker B domain-containing protein [Luteolibacter sp.]
MRVHLSRVIAINWYGYRRFIDLSGLTLITGANGSGKSVLLDLIQFVMLGEQLSRFNKAAAGAGSGRSLRGYCLCDTNTQGNDGQEKYLRPSGVTIAGLEFAWPAVEGEETKRETWGARIEFEGPTSRPRTVWFTIPGRLEQEDFLTTDLGLEVDGRSLSFMSEEEFRVHVKRDLGGDVFDRQTSYLAEMASRGHLAFDRDQMNKTLPNSMAFQPVESFEKFIREYLLEPGLPDVKAVRTSVDAHRRAQERLEKMHDQLERLTRISDAHENYHAALRDARLNLHVRDALAHEQKAEVLAGHRDKLDQLRAQNAEHVADHEAALTERNEKEQQLSEVRLKAGNDSQIIYLAESRARREEVAKEVEALNEASRTARQFLHDRTQHWKQWLRHAQDLGLEEPEMATKWLKEMQGDEEPAALDAAARMPRIYQQLVNEAREQLRPIEDQLKDLESRESRLVRELDDLDQKGSAAPSPLLDALKSRGQRAESLGRVIEVKEEAEDWWPLLESLLGEKRNAVLPENFSAAWNHALRLGHSGELLVNPEELDGGKKSGGVAKFFETKNDLAANYLNHLFGDLVPVETAAHLDAHPRAFSKDGWLKDPPHRFHLEPSREFTIGQEGLRRLREIRQDELLEISEQISITRRSRDDWKMFLHRGEQAELDKGDAPAGSSKLRDLPRLRKDLLQLDENIRLLATPEREAVVEKLRVLEKTFQGVIERIGRLSSKIEKFAQEERETLDAIEETEEEERAAFIQRQTTREKLEGVLEGEIQSMISSVIDQFPKWQDRIGAVGALAQTRQYDADKARNLRDVERRALAETHSEISAAFDPADESNAQYDARRIELETHEIERFKAEAEDARKEWENRLQHQVLDVLKEKLEEAERTKRELNKAMDHDIGGWRYQLTMRADRSHSAIWALVEKGLNPGLELFASGAREEIENAKAELMAAIENNEDPRFQKKLDYRYYHHWDIQATPTGKGEGAAISLNKNAKKQSGGENQAPFFVAMLAAFQRVYDIGRREDRQNLGIVIMDEAFSKLSGDRIDACLALARNFGLQLVMAFPEDRLPTMIRHAETVVQCRVERRYDGKGGAISDIENWVVKVDRDKLAAALS